MIREANKLNLFTASDSYPSLDKRHINNTLNEEEPFDFDAKRDKRVANVDAILNHLSDAF